MTKTHPTLLPSIERFLAEFGERLRSARLRRKLTTTMVAERAGISRPTLRQAEKGMGTVSISAYAQILLALNLEKDLTLLAKDDELGRHLQDASLPQRVRPKSTSLAKGKSKK
jgi:transcriptional regulator with XRE-family HTH domain